MKRGRQRNGLRFEMLEDRQLLSATADVVILMDVSDSSVAPATQRFEFTSELVTVLDEKLASRGIGGQPDEHHDNASSASDLPEVPANRYAVIEWGGNQVDTNEPVEPETELHTWPTGGNWTNATDAASFISFIAAEPKVGGNEDAWEAVHFAAGSTENEGQGAVAGLNFRTNAAVHFVVVTDSPSHDDLNVPFGSNLGPGLAHRRGNGMYFSATYEEILTSLQKEHLFSGINPNLVSDAVVTFIAGSDYDESQLDSFGPGGQYNGKEILGADLNFQDGWNVDKREMSMTTPNDSSVYIESDTVIPTVSTNDEVTLISSRELYFGDAVMFESNPAGMPGGLSADEVYYIIDRADVLDGNLVDIGDTFKVSTSIGGPAEDITSVGNPATLKMHLPVQVVNVDDDFSSSVLPHYEIDLDRLSDPDEDFIDEADGNPIGYPSGVYEQNAFEGELYGYLTWATGGTYWDIETLFETGNDIDSPRVNMYMQAIAADMFEKISTQITDFDGDGFAVDVFHDSLVVGDLDDVNLLLSHFGTFNNNIQAKYDLDVDGDVDEYDLIRLVVLMYYSRQGDANLDGIVNAQDLTELGQHWQQSVDSWFDGDFNGDGFVDAQDLTDIALNWLQEHP